MIDLTSETRLSKSDKNFIYKRVYFSHMLKIGAWGISISSIAAWLVIFWLKPTLVSSSQILNLIKTDQILPLQLAEIAVTGASAMSAIFVLLVFIAWLMASFSSKEKHYLDIIEQLQSK